MNTSTGKKIITMAGVISGVLIGFAVLLGFIVFMLYSRAEETGTGIIIALFISGAGFFVSWVFNLLLNGFGELILNVHEIAKKTDGAPQITEIIKVLEKQNDETPASSGNTLKAVLRKINSAKKQKNVEMCKQLMTDINNLKEEDKNIALGTIGRIVFINDQGRCPLCSASVIKSKKNANCPSCGMVLAKNVAI